MGLFDGIQTAVEDIQTGVRIKPGPYEFQLTDATYLEFDEAHEKMPNQAAVVFELTVIGGDEESEIGKKYSAFCRIPNEEEQGEKSAMFASILKQNMLQFGIPESKLATWNPEDQDDLDAVIGITGVGTIKVNKKNSDFDNLYGFKITEESSAGAFDSDSATGQFDPNQWSQ